MNKIYIFPVKYPFTINTECFLDDEMQFISKEFDKVIIIPLKKETNTVKKIPSNCEFLNPILPNNYRFIINGIYCKESFRILINDFILNNVLFDFKKLKIWIIGYLTINNLLNSKELKKIKNGLTLNDVCYFYWGKWSNILAYFWKGKAKFISRFHGYGDLWEEKYSEYFPIRLETIRSLDSIISISKNGTSYLINKYNCKNISTHPLGSFDNGISNKSTDNVIRIVSCSSLWPLKRVPLILMSVKRAINLNIEWTHIGGGGSELKKLEGLAKQHSDHRLSIQIKGMIPHHKVLEYYRLNQCDIFINLSEIEGVPVSIMEAISFNIPVIATDVGGTSDIVNNKTGVLVSANPSTEEIVNAIYYVVKNYKNFTPRAFWNDNYNASKNYSYFAQMLTNL